MRRVLHGSVFAALVWSAVVLAPAERSTAAKLLETGWDMPTTQYVAANYAQMERESPFDGVMILVDYTDRQGQRYDSRNMWNDQRWTKVALQPVLENLQAARWSKFTDNYLMLYASPTRLDWGDDAAWKRLTEKVGVVAWLAREGGLKGLAFDPEPYGVNQWSFNEAEGRSFAATQSLARQRGTEFMQAIQREYPGAPQFWFFMLSQLANIASAKNVDQQLPQHKYALMPSFVEGVLAAAPPTVRLVDGYEDSYYFRQDDQFSRGRSRVVGANSTLAQLLSPTVRDRWADQVSVGFGLWLDRYIVPPTDQYYAAPLDGSRLRRFQADLDAAVANTDQYVWLYGQTSRWWSGLAATQPWNRNNVSERAGRGLLWEESAPGILQTIEQVVDPGNRRGRAMPLRTGPNGITEGGEPQIEGSLTPSTGGGGQVDVISRQESPAADNLFNVLANGDLGQRPTPGSTLPPSWVAWRPSADLAWDPKVGDGGTARVRRGGLTQSVPVYRGTRWTFSVDVLPGADAQASVAVRWLDAVGVEVEQAAAQRFDVKGSPGQWTTMRGQVTVPPTASRLAVVLQAEGSDSAWFDNVKLGRLAA